MDPFYDMLQARKKKATQTVAGWMKRVFKVELYNIIWESMMYITYRLAVHASNTSHVRHQSREWHQSRAAPVTCDASHVRRQSRTTSVTCDTSHVRYQSRTIPVTCDANHVWHQSRTIPVTCDTSHVTPVTWHYSVARDTYCGREKRRDQKNRQLNWALKDRLFKRRLILILEKFRGEKFVKNINVGIFEMSFRRGRRRKLELVYGRQSMLNYK